MRPVILIARPGLEIELCDHPCYDGLQHSPNCICHTENYGEGYDGAVLQNAISREDIVNRWLDTYSDIRPALLFLQLPNDVFLSITAY